jgi:hypothetical protein
VNQVSFSLKGAFAMLILGIMIGLLTGIVLGLALSFPLGSAFGIFINQHFSEWTYQIEIILVVLSAIIIFKLLNLKWKKAN